MKYITFASSKIAYTTMGQAEAPALLFVHGFCEDSKMWDSFLTPFTASYKIILVDLPGFGQSEALPKLTIMDMAIMIHLMLKRESVENCFWIGHSMGGYVGLAFAERFANMLNGLCLFHSHPYADPASKKKNRLKSAGFIEQYGVATFVEELIPRLFSKSFRKLYPEFLNQFVEQAKKHQKTGVIAATYAMLHRPDRSSILKNIHCPVLFIVGQQDVVINSAFSTLQLRLPSSSMSLILDEAGHMGMFEAEADCQAAIEAWLEPFI